MKQSKLKMFLLGSLSLLFLPSVAASDYGYDYGYGAIDWLEQYWYLILIGAVAIVGIAGYIYAKKNCKGFFNKPECHAKRIKQ